MWGTGGSGAQVGVGGGGGTHVRSSGLFLRARARQNFREAEPALLLLLPHRLSAGGSTAAGAAPPLPSPSLLVADCYVQRAYWVYWAGGWGIGRGGGGD